MARKSKSKIGKTATKVIKGDDGYTRVLYHDTVVVAFNEYEIILNSGGWQTKTTKTRMNQASDEFGLGFSVSGSIETRRYTPTAPWTVHYKGETLTFGDNMTLVRKEKQVTLADKSAVKARRA